MSNEKSQIGEVISTLKQQRDEIALKIHLGEMEAKEEFEKAKGKLAEMADEFEPLKDAAQESARNLFSSLQLVGEEIKNSFDRIYKSL